MRIRIGFSTRSRSPVRLALTAIAASSLVAVAGNAPVGAQDSSGTPSFAEFGAFLVDEEDPTAIYLSGPILEPAILDFRRARRAYPEAQFLVLNSPGGFMSTSLAIADEVNEAGFSTVIPSWAGCYSACAFIFFAGVERVALGEFGVHQFSSSQADLADAQRIMADVLELLGRVDTPQEVVSVMLRTPPDEMYVFTADEVAELAIDRGFSDGALLFEAAGDVLPTFGPPEVAVAPATLVLREGDGTRRIPGEATWQLRVDDGVMTAVAIAEFAREDSAMTIALAGPNLDADFATFAIGVWVDDNRITAGTDPSIRGVSIGRAGSSRQSPTTLTQVEYDADESRFFLGSLPRWLALDLNALSSAESIELVFELGSGETAVVTIGIGEDVATLLEPLFVEWREAVAALPLGDDPDQEVPRVAFLYENNEGPGI